MSAAKQASAKQAKQAKGTDEEARPEVYNAVKELLESLGVDEHEPQIIDMIIDFVFSYTTDVLQDAHAFSEAAGNAQGTVGQQDVELAIHSRVDMSLAQSPNLENLLKMAGAVNSKPLPGIHGAPGLPMPTKNNLLAPNAQYSRQAAEAAKEAAIEAAKEAAKAAAEAAIEAAALPQAMFIPQPETAVPLIAQPMIPVAVDVEMQPVATTFQPVAATIPTAVPPAAAAVPAAVAAVVPTAVPIAVPMPVPVPTAAVPPVAAPEQPAVPVPVAAGEAAVPQAEVLAYVEDVDMDDDGPQLIPPPT